MSVSDSDCFHSAVHCQTNHPRPHFQSVHCWWLLQFLRDLYSQQKNPKWTFISGLLYPVSLCGKHISCIPPRFTIQTSDKLCTYIVMRTNICKHYSCGATVLILFICMPSCKLSSSSHSLNLLIVVIFSHMQKISCLQNYLLSWIWSSANFVSSFEK